MAEKHTYRIFTIADYDREAAYLGDMHRQGWELTKVSYTPLLLAVRYSFRECPPEDMSYQLDFYPLNKAERPSYLQLFADCGWTYITEFNQFSYFRKPLSEIESQDEFRIYNDAASKLEMIKWILAWRLLPAFLVFLGLFSLVLTISLRWNQVSLLVQAALLADSFLLLILLGQLVYISWRFWRMRRQFIEEGWLDQ